MSKENWVTYELGVFNAETHDPDNSSCSNMVITGITRFISQALLDLF